MAHSYRNAFSCKKCPQNNGPDGCPAWVEYAETNPTGEVRVTKECVHQALPKMIVHAIAAANRPAAAIESTRNALVRSLADIAEAGGVQAMAHARALQLTASGNAPQAAIPFDSEE